MSRKILALIYAGSCTFSCKLTQHINLCNLFFNQYNHNNIDLMCIQSYHNLLDAKN
jgi:hypothetical protein